MKKINLDYFKNLGVIKTIINFKNSEYTPEFLYDKLSYYKEYFKTFQIKCVLAINDKMIRTINEIKETLKEVKIDTDTFTYELYLNDMEEVEIEEEKSLFIAKFNCKGRVYFREIKKIVANNETVIFDTVKDIQFNLKVTNATGNLTINNMKFNNLSNAAFTIDSINKKVLGIPFDNWNFFEFPKTTNKQYTFKIVGNATVELIYRGEL